jgi:amidase
VVGFKPTRELIPAEGLIFASERLDTVGLLVRSVTDAATMLGEIVRCAGRREDCRQDAVRRALKLSCASISLSGVRIGIPSNIADLKRVHPARQKAFAKVLHLLEAAGADIVQGIDVLGSSDFENTPPAVRNVLLDTELKSAIDNYLSRLRKNPQHIHTLKDLITFTKAHPREDYPQRNVAVLERALETDPNAPLYQRMLEKDTWYAGEGGIPGALARNALNLLLAPALSPTLNAFAAKAGSPCMSLRMGTYPSTTEVKLDPGNEMVDVAPGIP